MPQLKDCAICLRRWEWSETSQIVLLLTAQNGLIRGLAKGALRNGSKFSGGFDILTKGDFSAVIKPERDLQTITEWRMSHIWREPRRNLNVNIDSTLVADLLARIGTEGDPCPLLYKNTISYLDSIEQKSSRLYALMIWLLDTCKISGFEPILDQDVKTNKQITPSGKIIGFSPKLGGVTQSQDKTTWPVRDETIGLLLSFSKGGAPTNVPQKSLKRACGLLISWMREVLQIETESMRIAFPNLPQNSTIQSKK